MGDNAAKPRIGQLWLVPAQGEARTERVAEVALRVRTHRLYTFRVPDALVALVAPGVAVRAPFGRTARMVDGWCVRVADRPWDNTRTAILGVDQPDPFLSPALIELGLWTAGYYAAPPGRTLAMMVPASVRKKRTLRARPEGRKDGSLSEPDAADDEFALTAGQAAAVGRIEAIRTETDPFRVVLLFGVPGSGKTEVYVRAIRSVIAAGRQAILLVPEIALATQVVDRLARRFARVGVLHSRLTPAVRARTLRAISEGGIDLVIGTRTAVFAPLRRLGLIVVDEEQEASFKSLAAPYFHARDVAIKRGQIEQVEVVLGSATPSLETWHNSQTLSHYELLRLPDRVPGARLPAARAVDTARRELGQSAALISPELQAALTKTLSSAGQAVLLHNRRGYAVYLRCSRCGLTLRCDRCGATLIYHRGEKGMKCHRCGARTATPDRCLDSTCGGKLEHGGLAIQRLEEELKRGLPGARILRMDSDEMRRREDYAAALKRFEERGADILIGTQMIAKGLDFPGVQLVGIVNADEMLRFPDFRAAERAFQLLVQVVGRAGRREGDSLALIQTGERASPAIRHALTLDYESFAREELAVREALGYPPFGRLARILCLDARPGAARDAARSVSERLRHVAGRIHAGIRVKDAEPCPVGRLREMLRWQVLVHAPRGGALQELLHEAETERVFRQKLKRLTLDVDPLDLM
jgi:primosomal protein N' (replication factor Y)